MTQPLNRPNGPRHCESSWGLAATVASNIALDEGSSCLAERVGFVPREPVPINDLGVIGTARTSQIHSKPEYQVQNRYSAS
jgi:hypothetical protein